MEADLHFLQGINQLKNPEPIKPEPRRINVLGSGTGEVPVDMEIESLPPEQLGLSPTSLQIFVFKN